MYADLAEKHETGVGQFRRKLPIFIRNIESSMNQLSCSGAVGRSFIIVQSTELI